MTPTTSVRTDTLRRQSGNKQPIREYRMTVASTWYDPQRGRVEYELHFKAARAGDIRKVREGLAKRGIEYFQQYVYRKERRWISKDWIKARFERERPATKTQPLMEIDVRGMEFKGRQWKAHPFPRRILTYTKKRRKRRPAKARQPRVRRKRHAKRRVKRRTRK